MALTMDGYRRQMACTHKWCDEGEDSCGATIWICSKGCGAEVHGYTDDFVPETPEDRRKRLGLAPDGN